MPSTQHMSKKGSKDPRLPPLVGLIDPVQAVGMTPLQSQADFKEIISGNLCQATG